MIYFCKGFSQSFGIFCRQQKRTGKIPSLLCFDQALAASHSSALAAEMRLISSLV